MREHVLALTPPERRELKKRLRSRTLPAEDVRRARLILMLAHGDWYSKIGQTLACNRSYMSRWKQRFVEQRLAGLYARHAGRAVQKQTPKLEARILAWTRKRPPDGSSHWSTRKLAEQLRVSHMMVARVWKRASLRPHRLERYMASNNTEFEAKAADVIGIYVHPPSIRPCFVWMRSWPLKLWTAWIRSCRFGPIELNVTALSITAMAPYRCMPPSTLGPARCWGKPPTGTPAKSLWLF